MWRKFNWLIFRYYLKVNFSPHEDSEGPADYPAVLSMRSPLDSEANRRSHLSEVQIGALANTTTERQPTRVAER